MVKIFHMADTHLSHKRRKNVRDEWREDRRVSWIEYDFIRAFHNALDLAIKSKCDYVVHAGDLFDIPLKGNNNSPSEYSRAAVLKELRKFFEATDYKVPFILIDGNHGTYIYRNYSTIEFVKEAFPEVIKSATVYDLKLAMSNGERLAVEFDDIIFYLFPYFEFNRMQSYKKVYDDWITKYQIPSGNKISVAVAHGMIKGEDLHDYLFSAPYDYVALGHDHHQKRIQKNMWQAGSTERYTFAERDQKKGVLEVQLEKGKPAIVTPVLLPGGRKMEQVSMTISNKTSSTLFEKKIKELIQQYKGPFDGETAIRLKIKIKGQSNLQNWWSIEDKLTEIQKEVFTSDYNLLEFRWDTQEVEKQLPQSMRQSSRVNYFLIEDPLKDFEAYVRRLDVADEEFATDCIELGAELIRDVFGQEEKPELQQ